MITPMFAKSSGLRVTPDRETETPHVQGLIRRNLSNARSLFPRVDQSVRKIRIPLNESAGEKSGRTIY